MRRRRITAAVSSPGSSGCFDRGGDLLEQRIGAVLDEAGQEPPFLDRNPAQERAVAEDRGEQPPALRQRAPVAGGLCCGIVLRRGKRLVPCLEAEREKARLRRLRQPVAIG